MLCALLTELQLSDAVGADDCFFVDGSIQLFCLKMQLFQRASSWWNIILCYFLVVVADS